MFWLLVIGLIHAYLIWDGDILVPYALCGLLLLWWVRRFRARVLLAGGAAFLAVGLLLSIWHGVAWTSMSEAERAPELEIWMPTREQANEQLTRLLGSYGDVVAHRAAFVFMAQTIYFALFFFWRCGGMMLLGMALFKWGFLDGRRAARDYLIVAAVCLPVGLALAWYGTVALERVRFAMPERTVADAWNYTGAVFASIGYAAVLILVVKRGLLRSATQGTRGRWTDGVLQLPPPERDHVNRVSWMGLWSRRPVRLRAAACHRRGDLGSPARSEPFVAAAIPFRTRRVALAIADLLEAPADASRYVTVLVSRGRSRPLAQTAILSIARRPLRVRAAR